jgi:membrane-associated phospholipid phosphatase
MLWLENLDVGLFRFINLSLINPVFDFLMPFVSGNEISFPLFFALVAFLVVTLVFKGGARGRVFLLMMVLTVAVCDGAVCNTIKQAIGRARPFAALPDVHCLTGMGGSGSMPSSHAANWFAMAMVAFFYYRRSVWFMVPMASLVSFSRVYIGVHYPSDVLAGALLGAGCGVAVTWLVNGLWCWVGSRWFPLWWARLPSLLTPVVAEAPDEADAEPEFAPRRGNRAELAPRSASIDQHWLRLGYILIGLMFAAQMAYNASGTIELSEDEAYQWVWSKHLDISYYSKPPMIAYAQFIGTSLWGDNAFGVRFLSPVIAALLCLMSLRFFAREVNARAGFFLVLIFASAPILAAGSMFMTVDPLSVLFWTAAMFAGWRAVQDNSTGKDWLWVGLWMGLGFLSKYTGLFQLLCWAVFFWLWRPARKQLRRPGPYLALLVNLLCMAPVVIWNAQRDWITVKHVGDSAGAGKPFLPPFGRILSQVGEFVGGEFGIFNPIFFVGIVWAAVVLWRRNRNNPKLVYFFSMGAPLFLVYLLQAFHSRVLLNWIAPSVVPLLCLMVVFWDARWRAGQSRPKGWLTAAIVVGLFVSVIGHNTDLVAKLTRWRIPVNQDPLHRVRMWSEVARTVGEVRNELLKEGKPVFIIANHYGITGLVTFYLPEARAVVKETPLVYYKTMPRPSNQFYFWPGYTERKGENAVFVKELDRDNPAPEPVPANIAEQFESVTDLGVRTVNYHGRPNRPLQFFACRGLK